MRMCSPWDSKTKPQGSAASCGIVKGVTEMSPMEKLAPEWKYWTAGRKVGSRLISAGLSSSQRSGSESGSESGSDAAATRSITYGLPVHSALDPTDDGKGVIAAGSVAGLDAPEELAAGEAGVYEDGSAGRGDDRGVALGARGENGHTHGLSIRLGVVGFVGGMPGFMGWVARLVRIWGGARSDVEWMG